MIRKKPFIFIRHGQTDWNIAGLCQGKLNIPLNQSGREEARKARSSLPPLHCPIFATSSLARARETADILASAVEGAQVVEVPGLEERGYGNLEGASSKEMYSFEEAEDAAYASAHGIEEKKQFVSRVAQGVNNALGILSENVVIVSHGRIYKVLTEILLGSPIQQIPNALPVQFRPTKYGWTHHEYKDAQRLCRT